MTDKHTPIELCPWHDRKFASREARNVAEIPEYLRALYAAYSVTDGNLHEDSWRCHARELIERIATLEAELNKSQALAGFYSEPSVDADVIEKVKNLLRGKYMNPENVDRVAPQLIAAVTRHYDATKLKNMTDDEHCNIWMQMKALNAPPVYYEVIGPAIELFLASRRTQQALAEIRRGWK
jgi:hypothetical protein